MSKYANKWQNKNGKIVTSETAPDEYSYAIVAVSRVTGSSFRPYETEGSEAWRKAANKALHNHARANFEKNGH